MFGGSGARDGLAG